MKLVLEKCDAEMGCLDIDADLGVGSESLGVDSVGAVTGMVRESFGIGSEDPD
jgi:hypothetical protein